MTKWHVPLSFKLFDLLAYDGNTAIDENATANIKVNLYRPSPNQMGEQYTIYRIENDKLIPQNILSSSLNNVIFEADKTGRFALVYNDEIFSVQFVSDDNDYKIYDNLKVGDTIPTPEKPTKGGYTFMGWYSNENGTGTKFNKNNIVSGNTIYYAHWKRNSTSESSGSSGNSMPAVIYTGAEKADNRIILTIGKKEASVFGEIKTNDVAPIIRNDRTMLPARFVAEAMGAVVEWDDITRTVTITKDTTEIIITIDSETAIVNGEPINLDSPAFIENDRTYTPLRFIAENLGSTVEWNADSQIITIM